MAPLSIITPAYDHAHFLPAAHACLAAQPLREWEWIIVDDGSRDDTAAVVRKLAAHDGRVRYVRQENSGPSVARNRGAELAMGEWLLFLDADDLLLPAALETFGAMRAEAADHPEVGLLVGTTLASRDAPDPRRHLAGVENVARVDAFFEVLGVRSRLASPHIQGTFLRRRLLERHDLRFDGRLRTSEDRELLIRATAVAHVLHLPRPIAWYRTGIEGADERSLIDGTKLRAHRMVYERLPDDPAIRSSRMRTAADAAMLLDARTSYLRMLDAAERAWSGAFGEAAAVLGDLVRSCGGVASLAPLVHRLAYLTYFPRSKPEIAGARLAALVAAAASTRAAAPAHALLLPKLASACAAARMARAEPRTRPSRREV